MDSKVIVLIGMVHVKDVKEGFYHPRVCIIFIIIHKHSMRKREKVKDRHMHRAVKKNVYVLRENEALRMFEII